MPFIVLDKDKPYYMRGLKNYNEDKVNVCGPLGRYTYQMIYSTRKLEKFPINKVIEKIGLYSNISNKENFINKYNVFLSKYYF